MNPDPTTDADWEKRHETDRQRLAVALDTDHTLTMDELIDRAVDVMREFRSTARECASLRSGAVPGTPTPTTADPKLRDAIAAVREPQDFESGDAPHRPDLLNFAWMARRLASLAEFALSPAPGNGPRPEPARTWTTHHVTATRDIPEGHTGQRVRYAYNGDSWDGWLIGTGREFGVDEAYVMCDDGTRWVVLPDNITPIEAASVAQEGGE